MERIYYSLSYRTSVSSQSKKVKVAAKEIQKRLTAVEVLEQVSFLK
jgi:hypothetical protein